MGASSHQGGDLERDSRARERRAEPRAHESTPDGAAPTVHLMRYLQRTAGNQAVNRLLRDRRGPSSGDPGHEAPVDRGVAALLRLPASSPSLVRRAPAPAGAVGQCYDKGVFLQLCNEANTRLDLVERKAKAWMLSVAIAYGDAWKHHTDTLKDQAAVEKLEGDLILGAALAFLPGGIGGVVGDALKKAESSAFMIDGVKDLAKFGLRSTGNVGLSGGVAVGGGAGLTAFPTDPLQWRNRAELRIYNELIPATEALAGWQSKANSNDSTFNMDFNPVEAINALSIGGKRTTELAEVDVQTTALAFEKGFWAKWLELYGVVVVKSAGRVGVFAGAQGNVGKKIKSRCEAIGLDMAPYVALAQQRADDQAREFNKKARDPNG